MQRNGETTMAKFTRTIDTTDEGRLTYRVKVTLDTDKVAILVQSYTYERDGTKFAGMEFIGKGMSLVGMSEFARMCDMMYGGTVVSESLTILAARVRNLT